MLLIGGIVTSSIPMHAMTDESIEIFKGIKSTYAGMIKIIEDYEIKKHLSDLYEVISDVTDEKDFRGLDDMKRFFGAVFLNDH